MHTGKLALQLRGGKKLIKYTIELPNNICTPENSLPSSMKYYILTDKLYEKYNTHIQYAKHLQPRKLSPQLHDCLLP